MKIEGVRKSQKDKSLKRKNRHLKILRKLLFVIFLISLSYFLNNMIFSAVEKD